MPATGWNATDLLALWNRYAGRPATGDTVTDATKYDRLAKAQSDVIYDIAARHPECLYPTAGYGTYPTCTTTDNQIFTFGTDGEGYPLSPIGKTRIYPSLSAIPGSPWQPGEDYLDEGTQIRIPNNRTYSGTLYWRGITLPAAIAAATQPVLFPEPSRLLIVYKAVGDYANEGVRNGPLADRMDALYGRDFARAMLVWKTNFKGGGALGPLGDFGPVTSPYYGGGYVGGNGIF